MNAPSHPAQPNTRDLPVDALRGLAIVLVVLGHAIEVASPATYGSQPLHVLIYSFHLPLFAFLSGFLVYRSRELPAAEFIIRRGKALLVPYFAWLVVWWTLSEVRGGAAASLPRTLALAAIDPRTENALWFFYVLFECCVLFALTTRMGRSRIGLALGVLVALIAHAYQVGWHLDALDLRRVELLYPFFVFGFLVAKTDLRARLGTRALVAATFGYGACLALLWPDARGGLWLRTALDAQGPIFRAMAPLGVEIVALLAALGAILALLTAYDSMSMKVLRPQAWLGQRSLGIYASHKRVIYLAVELGAPGFMLPAIASLVVASIVTVLLSTQPMPAAIFLGKPVRRNA